MVCLLKSGYLLKTLDLESSGVPGDARVAPKSVYAHAIKVCVIGCCTCSKSASMDQILTRPICTFDQIYPPNHGPAKSRTLFTVPSMNRDDPPGSSLPRMPRFPSLARLPNLIVACRLSVFRPYVSPLGWSKIWFSNLCSCVTTSNVHGPDALPSRARSMFETSCLCVETPVQLVTMGPSKGALRGSSRILRRFFSLAVSSAP